MQPFKMIQEAFCFFVLKKKELKHFNKKENV